MEERAKSTLLQSAPWRRGVPWPLVAIEGVVLAGIGIYVLAAPDDARDIVRQLTGAVLLITSVLEAMAGFRAPTHPATPFRLFRAGVGVAVGLIVTLEPVSDYLEPASSRWILGLGLIGYGLIGLTATVAAREEYGIRIGSVITGVLPIVLGIMFFTGDETDSSRMNLIGSILLVFGVLLLAYALYLYRQAGKAGTQETAVNPVPVEE
jgi:uncharacterized membrane protein HdeD (DUF308 family)